MVRVTALTWNLHGSSGVDVPAVVGVVDAASADLVALQEVQRRHVAALGSALGTGSRRWAFKHWPIRTRPEGLGVLSPHPIVGAERFVLRRAPFWDWRRRVALLVSVDLDGRPVSLVDVHLSTGDDAGRRAREVATVLDRVRGRDPAPLIVGDLNDVPGSPALAALSAAGWGDTWCAVHDHDGPTNWTGGPRAGRAPTQRLDYVFAPPGAAIRDCRIAVDTARLDDAARLSDHLPVVATVELS